MRPLKKRKGDDRTVNSKTLKDDTVVDEELEMDGTMAEEETTATQDHEAEEIKEEEDGSGEDMGGSAETEGKKGFFGKKKEKKDPRDIQIEELNDQVRRTMAEFDNFRKRTEKEKSSMYEIGAKDIVEKMLPVVDNFERGLTTIPEEAKGTPFAEGMEMIYKQLLKVLEEAGVKPIEAVGQPFDPNLHNAVMHVEDDTLGENIISQELQRGYMYRDTVVRYSMVQVAN